MTSRLILRLTLIAAFVGAIFAPDQYAPARDVLRGVLLFVSMWLLGHKLRQQWLRARLAGGDVRNAVEAALDSMVPAHIKRLYESERQAYVGAFRMLGLAREDASLRRPEFSIHKGMKHSLVVPLLVIVCISDVPIAMLLLWGRLESLSIRFWALVLTIVSAAYMLIWALGDRYWVRRTGMDCTDRHLEIRTGLRLTVDVPWDRIAAAEMRHMTKGQMPADYLRASPLDRPNVVIALHEPTDLLIQTIARSEVRSIAGLAIYADNPARLVGAIQQHLAR